MIDFNVEKQNQILQFLKEKRKEIGYTLLDASEILKISPSYLKKLEDGEYKKTNLELLLNYYDLVGIDPQKLLYDLNILKDKPYYKIPIYGDLNAENIVDYILPTENIQFDEIFFGKPNADITIDDRAIRFRDNWADITEELIQKEAKGK